MFATDPDFRCCRDADYAHTDEDVQRRLPEGSPSQHSFIMSELSVPGMSDEEQLNLALKRSAEEEERKRRFVHSTTSQDLADALAISKLTADAENESREAALVAAAVTVSPPAPVVAPVASPIAAPALVINPGTPFAVEMPDGSFSYYDAAVSATLTQWIIASPLGGSWQLPSSTCEVRWGSVAAQFLGEAALPGIVQFDLTTGATALVLQMAGSDDAGQPSTSTTPVLSEPGAPSATSVRSPPSDSLASRTAAARLERAAAREEEKKSEERKEKKSTGIMGRIMKGIGEAKGELLRDEWSETLMNELVEAVKGKDLRGNLRDLVDFEELYHQAKLQLDVGVKRQTAVQKAVDAALEGAKAELAKG